MTQLIHHYQNLCASAEASLTGLLGFWSDVMFTFAHIPPVLS